MRSVEVGPPGEKATLEISQTLDILADIDGQIYARDFKLIDQSDMIVSFIPEVNGSPGPVQRGRAKSHTATRRRRKCS